MQKFLAPLVFCSLFLTLSLVCRAQEEEEELVKIESSVVVLNATITDRQGLPVTGLKRNQFRILEDGVEQKIDFFETEETPFAAVLLLDTSGSMEERVSLARSASIHFLYGLRPDDMVAIYNFDSKVSMVQDFSNSRDISHHVFELKADGQTVLNDAIYQAAEVLSKRPEKRKAIIVLSDGADTRSGYSSSQALKAALATDITIYSVDMSSMATNGRDRMQNQSVLKNFAEKTGGYFIKTPGGAALRDAFENIVKELGVQYTLGYYPINQKKDGKWRKIDLRVAKPDLDIRTRKGYNAPK
ncbi:MAG: VWA domain-containing protein [Pyrinomonadaceae bacterium]